MSDRRDLKSLIAMARARSHRERRSAHRTRYLFDGLNAVDIAFVVLMEVMVKTTPLTAKFFVDLLTEVINADTGMTPGTRANLEKIRRIVNGNNKRGGLH